MKLKSRAALETLLREGLSWCMKCGACLSGCPVYRRKRDERGTMRGKLALLQAIEAGREIPPDTVSEVLGVCTGCQACRTLCPNGIDTVLLTRVARLLLAEKGTHDWTDRAGASVRKYQLTSRLTLAAMPMLIHGIEGIQAGRLLRSLPRRVFQALREEPEFTKIEAGAHLLFPGCALSQDPDRLGKLERINQRLKLGLVLVPDLGCCGMPELGIASAQRYAEQVSRLFERLRRLRPRRVSVACHRCLTGLRYIKTLFDGEPEETSLLGRFDDFFGLLAATPWEATRRLSRTVTVHDPCHLLRVPGARAATRTIFSRILETQVVEPPGEPSCCGFGGSFVFRHPSLAGDLRRERVEQLRQAGAHTVATACSYCADSLELPLRRQGIETAQLIDLVAQALE